MGARKSYKHRKPFEEWDTLLKEHHEDYIDWAEFERNQKQLATNAYGKAGDENPAVVDRHCWQVC
jgi:hypothetical protein